MRKVFLALALGALFVFAAPAMAADGTISGTVTHTADGTAVDTIVIYYTNTATSVGSYTVSGADGTYSFTAAPGTYDVSPSTSALGESGVTFVDKTTTVVLSSGETESGINFALTRRAKFTGHIYASDGVTPVSGANIYTTHASGSASGYGYGTSLTNGSYTATPTPTDATTSAVGTYSFTVSASGYFPASVTGVALGADETTTTKDITLTSASTVAGTITDANGAAVSGATVTVTKSTGSAYTAVTGAAGTYTVSIFDVYGTNGTAVGEYTITVSKTGYITTTGAATISVDATAMTGKNFALVTGGSITGTVTAGNVALASATVTADDGFGSTYSTTSASDGTYTLSSLRASTRYTVTFTKTNYVTQKLYNITVTAGATTSGKNATLPAATTFSGTVKTSAGAVLEGAYVYLYKKNKTRSDLPDYTYTTKGEGTFSFTAVAPGKYRVRIVKAGYVTLVKDSVNLATSKTAKTYTLPSGATIFGRVTSSGSPIGSVDLYVYAMKNGKEVSFTSVSTDDNGYYRVSSLKKGKYKVRAIGAEHVAKTVTVTVQAGNQKTTNFSLKRAGSISGFITDTNGLPVSALVRVVGKPITVWSDLNGYYVLEGVAAGSVRINAVSAYYNLPGRVTVTVSAGATTEGVNFTLMPKE